MTRAGRPCHQLMDLLPSLCSLHLPLPPSFAGSGPVVCPKVGAGSWDNCCEGRGDQTPYSWRLPQCPQDRDPSVCHCWNLDLSLSPHVMDGLLVFPGQGPLYVPHATPGPSRCLSAYGPLVLKEGPSVSPPWSLSVPRGGRDPSVSPHLMKGSRGQGPFSFLLKPGGSSARWGSPLDSHP